MCVGGGGGGGEGGGRGRSSQKGKKNVSLTSVVHILSTEISSNLMKTSVFLWFSLKKELIFFYYIVYKPMRASRDTKTKKFRQVKKK